GMEPTSFDELRPGCYDIHQRVRDMDANGVLGSLCFPSFPNLCGQLFARSADKEAALAILQAYNNWHIDEWCGAYPGRFIPVAILPMWDVDAMVAEGRRVVAKGCHSVAFPDNPTVKGLPSIHNPIWEPFWRACADNNVVINCHIGTGNQPAHPSMESPIEVWTIVMPMAIALGAADWLHLD